MFDHTEYIGINRLFGHYGGCQVCGYAKSSHKTRYCSDYCKSVAHAVRGLYSWSRIREFVKERDDYECVRCGASDELQIDHVIPTSKGGHSFAPTNLQTLCRSCNASKQDDAADYRDNSNGGEFASARLLVEEVPEWVVGDPPAPLPDEESLREEVVPE